MVATTGVSARPVREAGGATGAVTLMLRAVYCSGDGAYMSRGASSSEGADRAGSTGG